MSAKFKLGDKIIHSSYRSPASSDAAEIVKVKVVENYSYLVQYADGTRVWCSDGSLYAHKVFKSKVKGRQ